MSNSNKRRSTIKVDSEFIEEGQSIYQKPMMMVLEKGVRVKRGGVSFINKPIVGSDGLTLAQY